MVVYKTAGFSLDEEAVIEKMKLRGPSTEKGLAVAREVSEDVEPWFVCKECHVESISGDEVVISGTVFHSAFLARILGKVNRVIAYVTTCGVKMSEHTRSFGDIFERYIAEGAESLVLDAAKCGLETFIETEWGHRKFSHVNPGSIEDWSTLEIGKIFDLLEGRPYELGMTLTDSGLMQPTRSVSGFYFESETPYFNCMLCQRHCPNRKAAFDEALYSSFRGTNPDEKGQAEMVN
ncbi:MAG: hypothetical protein MI742_01885 [Desulfobacterales bacterium]|nr:hypothetical protein [Desulfobacterales bacterium]